MDGKEKYIWCHCFVCLLPLFLSIFMHLLVFLGFSQWYRERKHVEQHMTIIAMKIRKCGVLGAFRKPSSIFLSTNLTERESDNCSQSYLYLPKPVLTRLPPCFPRYNSFDTLLISINRVTAAISYQKSKLFIPTHICLSCTFVHTQTYLLWDI